MSGIIKSFGRSFEYPVVCTRKCDFSFSRNLIVRDTYASSEIIEIVVFHHRRRKSTSISVENALKIECNGMRQKSIRLGIENRR